MSLGDIGTACDPVITIERGSVSARAHNALGSSLIPTVVAPSNATLFVADQIDENIILQNSTGFGHQGALRGFGTITGNVDLGTSGSVLGGTTIRGMVTGTGTLEAVFTGTPITLANANNTYSGATVIRSGAKLILSEGGRLPATSNVEVHRAGQLVLKNEFPFGVSDRIPDSTSIRLNGGGRNILEPSITRHL
jgi:hypothetical protein